MFQNAVVTVLPRSSQMLFSLSMRNVDEIFPGFEAGDFAVVYGLQSVQSLTSLLCIRAQLPSQIGGLSSNVVFIDGGNTFRLYQVARLAQLHQLSPKQALDRIFISRAFTAYQMTALIMEHLKKAVERFNAKLVVLSDIAGLFLDKDIPDEEARRVFGQVTVCLSNFARENQVILIATYPPRQSNARNLYLHTLTCGRANVVIALRQTKYHREFALEKHPRFTPGSAEFPSGNIMLTQFL